MKKYIEILKKCRLFEGIDEDELLKMLTCLGAKVDFYDKKYTVFREGMKVMHIGIVLSGSVQLEEVDYSGNRSIIGSFGKGELFAEAFASAGIEAIPLSVVCAEPSEIMLIDFSRISYTCHNACCHHQRLIYNLMKDIAEKTVVFHEKIDIISKRTTREKLLSYLNYQAKKSGKFSFTIPYDRQELADYLGVDRSGLSVEISKLSREGMIEARKNSFKLKALE